MDQLEFSSADWGNDPLKTIAPLERAGNSYTPVLYTALARTYAENGHEPISRDLLYARSNYERSHSGSWWTRWQLTLTWLLAGYGYRPEWGLYWIIGLVGLGALVLRRGSAEFVGSARPRNSLLLAIDSVIPFIQLDKEHTEVRYSGWRQGVLYLLRFLGAVVVVIILEFMRRSLTRIE